MSKQQHRSEIGIIADILGVTMDAGSQGVIITTISRMANLSHNGVLEKCQKLVDAKIIESIKDDRNRSFRITEPGRKFFQEIQRFQNTVQGMNLKY